MSNDHSMDGIDPDGKNQYPITHRPTGHVEEGSGESAAIIARPRHVFGSDWQWCNQAVQDHKELAEMNESERRHYIGKS